MGPCPASVAVRHLEANRATHVVAPDDVARSLRNGISKFEEMWGTTIEQYAANPASVSRYTLAAIAAPLTWLIHYGRQLAEWAVNTRSIPAGKAKALELAVRTVRASGKPRQPVSWWLKNRKHLELLLAASTWPERGHGDGAGGIREVVDVDTFKVHNTVHLTGDKLDKTIQTIEQAVRELSSAPKLARVIYGDVYVVGQLRKSKTLAWYEVNEDRIYLRPHPRVGRGELHNLLHELGHRYWFQFLARSDQQSWATWFFDVKRRGENAPRQKVEVGQPLPVPVKGQGTPPIVREIRGERIFVEGSEGFYKYQDIWNAMRGNNIRAQFPTPYAATSYEEYFAEAFAMHLLGTLPEEHKGAFVEHVDLN